MTAAPPDANAMLEWLRAMLRAAPFERGDGLPLPLQLPDLAARLGEAPALIGDDETLSYAGLARRANQYARWARAAGLAPGEVVGLILDNCPDHVAIWLGVTSVGGVVALIDPAQRPEALARAVAAVSPRHLIVGAAREAAVAALPDTGAQLWAHGPGAQGTRLDTLVRTLPGDPLGPGEARPPALPDLALYVFTAGTTGRPKAARMSHRRIAGWGQWFAGMLGTQPADRLYVWQPLHHATAGVLPVAATLAGGGSVLIRPRFRADRFWDEVAEHGCTLVQYTGEVVQDLLGAPPHPRERAHRLRLGFGAGLRGNAFGAFKDQFGIPRLLEFYASTEGNVALYNVPGRPGALGNIPGILSHRFPIALLRCDPDTGALLRGADGLCVPCATEEIGEAMGRIVDEVGTLGLLFEGYADEAETEARIARDVRARGDAWYRTGDLMRRDAAGFLYYEGRVGP